MQSTFSKQLWSRIELQISFLNDAFCNLYLNTDLNISYPRYLILMYQIIRASVPLMKIAAEESIIRSKSCDDVAEKLVNYFNEHIEDELNHDEWLLNDLKEMGYSKQNIYKLIPSEKVSSVVGSQYYWIYHYHPVSLLGYIAVLEGYPVSIETLKFIQSRTSYPDSAFRTLYHHAYQDPVHKDHLDNLLNTLILTEEQKQLILSNSFFTVRICIQLFKELSEC